MIGGKAVKLAAGTQAFYEAVHDNSDREYRKEKFKSYWGKLADRKAEIMPRYIIARERRKGMKRAYDEARRNE